MTAHSRNPAFVVFDYHSPFAPHKQQFKLADWNAVSSGHPMGTVTAHDSTSRDLQSMCEDLLAVMSVFALSDIAWDMATVYTQAEAVGPAFPQAQFIPTQAGTGIGAAPRKATEFTFIMRTDAFNIAKLVIFDVAVNTNFDSKLPAAFGSAETDFLAEIGDMTNGWVGLDGHRIVSGIKETYNLNQKLRKEYRMT